MKSEERLASLKYETIYKNVEERSQSFFSNFLDTQEIKSFMQEALKADKERCIELETKIKSKVESKFQFLQQIGFNNIELSLQDGSCIVNIGEGRDRSAFTFTYPLQFRELPLGDVRFSYTQESFIERMKEIYNEESHFLMQHSQESPLYIQSIKQKKYTEHVCSNIQDRDDFMQSLKQNSSFSLYYEGNIITFISIKNREGEHSGYFVSSSSGERITTLLNNYLILNAINLFIFFILIFMVYKEKRYKSIIENSKKKIIDSNNILQTIVYVQQELIENNNFTHGIENSLKKVVEMVSIDRVYIFKNSFSEGEMVCSQIFEFTKEHVSVELNSPLLQNVPYTQESIKRWKETFEKNESIEGLIREFPSAEREILEPQNIQSILVMPIWYKDEFWGFIGFDECSYERVWKKVERDLLQVLANTFVNALDKENYTKNLTQQVNEQLKELKRKDRELQQQSKLAQMGDMVSMIAHQWRQPLNAISATGINLSLLSNMNMLEDTKVQNSSEFIQEQCQKMSRTIDTFINFVKPSKVSQEFKLIHAIESVLEIMGTQLENHNIEVRVGLENRKLTIEGFEDLLEQVVLNLFSNARDAFEEQDIEEKYIKIDIHEKDNQLKISVEDNAGGVPEDIRDKIFNPYFTTKEQGKGTGIGLYMSLDIMQKSFQGDLKYFRTTTGSRFEIIF